MDSHRNSSHDPLMKLSAILLILAAGITHAQEPAGKTLWRTSMAALATANALDMHSSWGKHELNPGLAGPSGTFGREGALVKLGLQGGLMGIEWLITRRHPSGRVYRALSFINFGASGVMTSVAIHNYTVPRQRAGR